MKPFWRGVTLAFNPAGVMRDRDDEPDVWTMVMQDIQRACDEVGPKEAALERARSEVVADETQRAKAK